MKKTKYYLLLALVVIMSGCDDFLEPIEINVIARMHSDFANKKAIWIWL